MIPAPLCKTAIIKFLVDEETVPKLWNLSSNMRKRLQMVLEEMKITVREYNEKLLKITRWLQIGKFDRYVERTQDIKKGVLNYYLESQEQVDRVVSLNNKLWCYEIDFKPEAPLKFDYVKNLRIDDANFEFYSQHSFNRIGRLNLNQLSSLQIKDICAKFNQVELVLIESCSISDLDLSFINTYSVRFDSVIFSGEVKLPSFLKSLEIRNCNNLQSLKCGTVSALEFIQQRSKEPLNWIKNLKGLKEANVSCHLSECINYLPHTVRKLGNKLIFDSEDIDLAVIKKNLPLLIKADKMAPIEDAQVLNLRSICPEIYEFEGKLTIRPKEIWICEENVEELNDHPELFEKVEKVSIVTKEFNYDHLPVGISRIDFYLFPGKFEKLESLEKNNWKFGDTVVSINYYVHDDVKITLSSFNKVRKVKIGCSPNELIGEFPQFKFVY